MSAMPLALGHWASALGHVEVMRGRRLSYMYSGSSTTVVPSCTLNLVFLVRISRRLARQRDCASAVLYAYERISYSCTVELFSCT